MRGPNFKQCKESECRNEFAGPGEYCGECEEQQIINEMNNTDGHHTIYR
jgi:hypothetical protein